MNAPQDTCDAAVRAYVAFFEGLQPASLNALDRHFAPDVHFKDPFNDVVGLDAVRRIFEHMFANTAAPRFRVDDWHCGAATASIRWQFQCRLQGLELNITGMSCVRFDAQGKVIEHIDYWDPAAGIYERLPMLGGVMRYLRRRLSATQP